MFQDVKTDFLNNLISITWRGTCIVNLKKNNSLQSIIEKFDQSTGKMQTNRFSMKQVQFYGFLLLTILLPSTMSSPLRDKDAARNDEQPHWINPCPGVPTSYSNEKRSISEEKYDSTGTDADFMNSIIMSAKRAIFQARAFRDDYVLKTFSVDLETHHNQTIKMYYPWLRNKVVIPKELGENVTKLHLDALQLDDEAVKIYGFLQRLAVAFEQVIQDHRDQNSDFKEEFATAEIHLKSLLCELREIIPESKLAMFENANRELMAPEYRHMESLTHQHVRDWLIFRDYMNLIEYVIQVMEFFQTKTV